MQIVLEVCAERGLYYLDSKTTGKSVIPEIAEELHLPYLENNLFLMTLIPSVTLKNKLRDWRIDLKLKTA